MQKKFLFIYSIILVAFFIVTSSCLVTVQVMKNKIKEEVINHKIEYFTNNYFSFVEKVKINTSHDEISLSVSFIPEVGSFPIKEEIYQDVAYHALQIVSFFPEVNHFDYAVIWNHYSRQEVLILTIDKDAVKELPNIYYGELINQNSGLKTSFKNTFSLIIETEESKSWRNTADTDSVLP